HTAAAKRLRDVLPADTPSAVGLAVGPEGGFSDGEVEGLAARGARVATLGERILRTETAGYIAAALVLYNYGSLG
ncbi:MAG: RsmE family RNA methyltransferase, partial [Candidatus Binatia bacterium]